MVRYTLIDLRLPDSAGQTKNRSDGVNPTEIARVQKYLRQTFDNNRINLKRHSRDKESVEVLMEEEFIGVIYKDDEDGDISYAFNMAILEMDLPEID